jgi:hypothetical protein
MKHALRTTVHHQAGSSSPTARARAAHTLTFTGSRDGALHRADAASAAPDGRPPAANLPAARAMRVVELPQPAGSAHDEPRRPPHDGGHRVCRQASRRGARSAARGGRCAEGSQWVLGAALARPAAAAGGPRQPARCSAGFSSSSPPAADRLPIERADASSAESGVAVAVCWSVGAESSVCSRAFGARGGRSRGPTAPLRFSKPRLVGRRRWPTADGGRVAARATLRNRPRQNPRPVAESRTAPVPCAVDLARAQAIPGTPWSHPGAPHHDGAFEGYELLG